MEGGIVSDGAELVDEVIGPVGADRGGLAASTWGTRIRQSVL
jgi:hypothetical protein